MRVLSVEPAALAEVCGVGTCERVGGVLTVRVLVDHESAFGGVWRRRVCRHCAGDAGRGAKLAAVRDMIVDSERDHSGVPEEVLLELHAGLAELEAGAA